MTQAGDKSWGDDHHCLVCGSENPIGLKLQFQVVDGALRTHWVGDKRFQGYADVVHGGMISLILDETMVNLPWKRDGVAVVSAELTTRLLAPARIGERLSFIAEAGDTTKKVIMTQGRCLGEGGRLIAQATAKCVRVKNHTLNT